MVMTYIWLAIFIATLLIELSAPGLVSIWFSAGSFVSLILSIFLQDSYIWLQILVFVLVSICSLLLIRPYVFKKKLEKKQKTNVDTLIGELARCTKTISNLEGGAVKLRGIEWTAMKNDKTEEINENDIVEIVKIEGNKLIVRKTKEN